MDRKQAKEFCPFLQAFAKGRQLSVGQNRVP